MSSDIIRDLQLKIDALRESVGSKDLKLPIRTTLGMNNEQK